MAKKITPQLELLIPETYLTVIKNSVGSKMFRHLYARVNGKHQDILRHGELSCAFYVAAVLRLFTLIEESHATVAGLLKDMKKSGWKKIRTPRPGCVIHWSGILYPDGEYHEHIGFYLGQHQAISNSTSAGVPKQHHWTYGGQGKKPKRPVLAMYWHSKLSSLILPRPSR